MWDGMTEGRTETITISPTAFSVGDKKKATEKLKSFMERIENFVRIWENVCFQYFLLFPVFQKFSFLMAIKSWDCMEKSLG